MKTDFEVFNGFSPQTLQFLVELGLNNDKTWFEENRQRYTDCVKLPFQSLANDLGPTFTKIHPAIEIRPAKVISRINRDTRFSKDKSPYRNNLWITFRENSENLADTSSAPAFYFELFPSFYRYGLGFYQASKPVMDRFRRFVDNYPESFQQTVKFFYEQDIFTLEGDMYKRNLAPEKDAEILNWYNRKSFFLNCSRDNDELLFSGALVGKLIEDFEMLGEFYHFMRGI